MTNFLQSILQQLQEAAEPLRLWTKSDTFFRDIVFILFGAMIGFIVNELTGRPEVR